MVFTMMTDFEVDDRVNGVKLNPSIPNGLWFGIVDPNMFCSRLDQTDCLPAPTPGSSFPENSFYMEQASRRLYTTFTNTGVGETRNVSFCGMGMMSEVCSSKSQCDAEGWANQEVRNERMSTMVNQPSVYTDFTNSASRPVVEIIARERIERQTNRLRMRQYVLTVALTFPRDLFVRPGDGDTRFALFDADAPSFLSWGYFATDIYQKTCTEAGTTSHKDFITMTPYLQQVLPQREDAYRLEPPHTKFPSTSPSASPTFLPTPAIIGIGVAGAGLLYGGYRKVCRRATSPAAGDADAYDLIF